MWKEEIDDSYDRHGRAHAGSESQDIPALVLPLVPTWSPRFVCAPRAGEVEEQQPNRSEVVRSGKFEPNKFGGRLI